MPETLLSPETCTPNRAVYRHAVAFSTSAEAGEHRHPARRATGDPPGKTDSVGEAEGVSVSERCLFSRRAIGDPPGKTDSVGDAGGVSVSERCMGPSTIRFAYRDNAPSSLRLASLPAVAFSKPAEAGENPQVSSGEPPTLTLQQADACLLSVLSSQAKPGTESHALKRCGACHPAQRAARRFARQAGQRSRRRRNERSECCLFARRAGGDPQGKTDSAGIAEGTNAVSVA